MADEAGEVEKNLPPSERKKQRAREDGSGLKAPDLFFLLTAMLMTAGLWMLKSSIQESWQRMWDWSRVWDLKHGLATERLLLSAAEPLGMVMAVCFVAAMASAIGAWVLGGFIWSSKAIWNWDRLNPMERLGSMFSLGGTQVWWPLVKGLSALGLMCWGIWSFWVELRQGSGELVPALVKGAMPLGIAFVVLAGLDLLIQWMKRNKELSMSLQELKDEMKETEGDPMVKSRQRAIARQRAKKRMMAAVKQADVVVVNPEHYLVALKWTPGKAIAPVVVARGLDALALNLKQEAKQSGVPVLEAPPFARALWGASKLDAPIPAQFFEPVAVLLAWAYAVRDGQAVMEPQLEVPNA